MVSDCYPHRFVNPDNYLSVNREHRENIFSLIFSLALTLKRTQRNLANSRKYKEATTELTEILKQLRVIDYPTKNDHRSIYNQVWVTCRGLLKIFEIVQDKLNVNVVEHFIKYCRKKNNFFYQIASPIFDEQFCQNFNKIVRNNKKNSERQEYLAISRICNGLSYSQTTEVNKQVCIIHYLCYVILVFFVLFWCFLCYFWCFLCFFV